MPENDTGMRSHGVPVHAEPDLGTEERAHLTRVLERLAQEIRHCGGWISFERFMEIALYAPGLGYYSAGAHKLGAAGDFVTAPEISALFGGCLARQCAEVVRALGAASVLEIGPGSGRLAVDVLGELERLGALPARYLLLEPSADLAARQRRLLAERIPHLAERIAWIDAPPGGGFEGIIVANEVLDALPVRRFRLEADRFVELGVALAAGRLVEAVRPADAALEAACRTLAAAGDGWSEGYESEYCPRLGAFAAEATRGLVRGLVLWIDYGLPRREYYRAERRGGTLLCHFRQRAHADPLHRPGLEDITAWVDFTALAEASAQARCTVAGFATQALFLAALGIDELIEAARDARSRQRLVGEAHRLLLPGEMGERFKVMGWTRGLDLEPAGFRLQDLRHTL